jgi:glutamine---fructose-6-phosphate transaminase (isomerizing)
MCGIIAYVGGREAQPILMEGLKRLEYRGYDSAGIAILNGDVRVVKAVGRVSALESALEGESDLLGSIGIAHTRWATHGAVTQPNAHPHQDDSSRFAIIHNGTIENYAVLRTWLKEKGHEFKSETDTEVLINLIAELYDGDLEAAVQNALREVTGAYAIAVLCKDEPGTLVVARKGSPLIVGVGSDEYIVASDPSGIVAHTSRAITLEDYQVCRLTRDDFRTTTIDNVPVTPKIQELEFELDQIELGDYSHYMLKEIFEQPKSLRNCLRGRIDRHDGQIVLGGVGDLARDLVKAKRYIMLAQGTAMHAAMVGEYLFEDLATVPTEVDYASEFRYRNPIIEEGSVVITVSQSGETLDTLTAMLEAKARGATTLGVVNVVGSSIARETDAGVYLRVGPEIGVASTKAFTGQVCVLTMLSLFLARRRYMSPEHCRTMLEQLERVPDKIEHVLGQSETIKAITEKHVHRDNWLFLGRGYNYPVALEGALKLKEISYIHAEGMPAAEMKHGPIALIDEGMPVVFIANHGAQYEKVLVNIEEVKTRGGHVIAVATEGDTSIGSLVEDVIYVPEVPDALSPMVTVVPLQLMAYHAAVLRGHDVDKPRNLAKSVTVE